jgi:tRNA-dihydrouridine synthase B
VVKHNGGSGMLREPATLEAVTRAVVEATTLPVVPKIRTGWDSQSVNAVEIAARVEAAGAHGLVIHGRTRKQGYSGQADWDLIAEVKKTVSIPLVGNGDLFEPEDIDYAMCQSGVDAVMLGRGAMGNPWVFSRTLSLWKNGVASPETSADERIAMLKRHNQAMFDYKGPHGLVEMRKHAMWYLKGLPNSAICRQQINKTQNRDEIMEILDNYQTQIRAGVSPAFAA